MKCILVYSKKEARRNAFSVQKYKSELGAELVTPDYRGAADVVINRSNDYRIAEYYESRGVRVFNPASFTRLANDKQATYDFMEQNGVEIMPTRYGKPPFVKKPRDGHGGQGVLMCTSAEEYDESAVCQKPASDLGRDLRVWVLGGEIKASMLRVSKTDFRSNFCLGGEAAPYALSKAQAALVKKIISLVEGDYYGVDFVFNDGRIVFNELEDAVGARMLYSAGINDIIKEYCDFIKRTVS